MKQKLAQLEAAQQETKSMVSVSNQDIQEPINLVRDKEEIQEAEFIAFARVYSGTLRRGQELYVLGPKYDPSMKTNTSDEAIDPNLKLKV